MKKIYVVRHHYNNGEHYEEYREYTEDSLFSTEDKAYAFFCNKIIPNYIGEYYLLEKELDTQKETLIEQSPWIDCAPCNYGYDYGYEAELEAENEWLTTRREHGEILDEIETDRLSDTLKESDEVRASLGMLD